jgi:hypothetical protein
MPDQLAFLPERVFTAAAMPGAGYRVEFFQSGTTTAVTVYTTALLAIAHPSPLVCDANGVFPAVFSSGGAIKAVVTKPDGSSFYTLDPVFRVSTSGAGAAEISFAPTPGLPFTNVQDAVEAAAASAASGFTPFGLGVTGTNALIANIDATNTASGSYRFDNTTTGTFPTGVTAANTGTVQIERENSGDAVMFLQSGAADRAFFRRMAGSTWGAWQEVITVPQGAAEGDIIYRGASAWLRLAKGTALQLPRMNSGATAPEWFGGSIGPTNTTSGTSVDSTGIASGAQRIDISLNGVVCSSSFPILQAIVSGSPVASGYTTMLALIDTASSTGAARVGTNGIIAAWDTSAHFGQISLVRIPGTNNWSVIIGLARGTSAAIFGGGIVTLSGEISGFRMTTISGGGTFSAGSFSATWR